MIEDDGLCSIVQKFFFWCDPLWENWPLTQRSKFTGRGSKLCQWIFFWILFLPNYETVTPQAKFGGMSKFHFCHINRRRDGVKYYLTVWMEVRTAIRGLLESHNLHDNSRATCLVSSTFINKQLLFCSESATTLELTSDIFLAAVVSIFDVQFNTATTTITTKQSNLLTTPFQLFI